MVAFRMLGPFQVHEMNGQRIPVRRRNLRALLALLVIRSGRPVGTEEIVDALWGPRPPASARANLHSHASDVRRLLAGGAGSAGPRLLTTPAGYQLHLRADACDAVVFERLAAQGRAAVADGRAGDGVELLTGALGMWRGRFLEDLESYDWIVPVANRLEETRRRAVEDWVDGRLQLRQHVEVAVELAELTAAHPLRERLWHQYLLALYRADRRTDALIAYGRLSAALAEELGVQPAPALQSLYSLMRLGARDGGRCAKMAA